MAMKKRTMICPTCKKKRTVTRAGKIGGHFVPGTGTSERCRGSFMKLRPAIPRNPRPKK